MRNIPLLPLLLTASLLGACSPEDDDRCGEALIFNGTACVAEDTGGGGGADAGAPGLGGPCSCEGTDCDQSGMPTPTGGTIVGCDDVPLPWDGAELACLRTNASGLGPESFFANGYCTLMAVDCDGDELICDSATVGVYAGMVTCPGGSALVATSGEIDMMGMAATLDTKFCAPLCEAGSDCRSDEVDPLLDDAPTGYECYELDGVSFCYDPRNLSADATAEAF